MSAEANPVPTPRRAGLCDFVPDEGALTKFAARFHPKVQRLLCGLKQFGIETLLEEQRLLALMELVQSAAKVVDGEIIELGVYKGGSAAAMAWALASSGRQRPFHLCDTFAGLPESKPWEFHRSGDFGDTACETVVSRLQAFVPGFPFRFHRGFFADTLPSLGETRFCFAHVDADLYESVHQGCEYVYPRMAKGGIIVFDDYGAPTCPGAKKAVDEFFADKLERPTHVARSAYGVRIGSRHTDFHRLLLRRSLASAGLNALKRVPRSGIGAIARSVSARLTSPRTSHLVGEPAFRIAGRRAGSREPDLRSAKQILVVRLDEIGDVALTSPLLRELRRNAPAARIALVVKPAMFNLVELCPHVDEVLTFDWQTSGHLPSLQLHARSVALARKQLWHRHFDLALLPRWDSDYYHATFLAYFSGAISRVGYSENVNEDKRRWNAGCDRLLTHRIDDRTPGHEVQSNLNLIRFLGGQVQDDRLELWLGQEDRSFAENFLDLHHVHPDDYLIAFGPGAGARKRIWPFSRFVGLAEWFRREYNCRIVIVGGASERPLGEELQNRLGELVINAVGRTTLRQAGALLQRCHLFVGNDAGPMHLAAAARVPVVEISCHPAGGSPEHANSPVRFAPWGVPQRVLQPEKPQPPCRGACMAAEAHCILGVDAEQVQEAVRRLTSKPFPAAALRSERHLGETC